MFQKIAKHRANDAPLTVHRPTPNDDRIMILWWSYDDPLSDNRPDAEHNPQLSRQKLNLTEAKTPKMRINFETLTKTTTNPFKTIFSTNINWFCQLLPKLTSLETLMGAVVDVCRWFKKKALYSWSGNSKIVYFAVHYSFSILSH